MATVSLDVPEEFVEAPRGAVVLRGRGRPGGGTRPREGAGIIIETGRRTTKTITIELPDDIDLPVTSDDEDFARALRLSAAIFWYDRGWISQGKGAEIAGLTRVEFIDALGRANVSAIQTSVEELRAEVGQDLHARRERLAIDPPGSGVVA